MSKPTTYELVIRGRASARLLRPFLDGFSIDQTGAGVTRLVGIVTDASHLHGLIGHVTSLGVELVSVVEVPSVLASTQAATQTGRDHT